MTRMETSFPRKHGPAEDDPLPAEDVLLAAIVALHDERPARPLWPGIEARLAPPAPAVDPRFAAGPTPRRAVTPTLPQLALAASLLIAVSGGVSWLALQPRSSPAGPPEPTIRAV